jgi:hypothetical protein
MRRVIKAQLALGGFILGLAVIAAVSASDEAQAGALCGIPTPTGPVGGVPPQLEPIYQAAASRYQLGAEGASMLAAINAVESAFGTNLSRSSAGAVGWMQFEPATWHQWRVTPQGTPAPDDATGWDNPVDAIYTAARYLQAHGAPNWQTAIFAYNHAQWYVDQVLNLSRGYYARGLTSVKSSKGLDKLGSFLDQTALAGSSACSAVAPGSYVNPFRDAHAIGTRIDMGTDYAGHGLIELLGDAQITLAGTRIGGGWTCSDSTNGGVVYQLANGPYAGKIIYVTEDVTPTPQALAGLASHRTLPAGTPIATFTGSMPCIEMGWGSMPTAAATLASTLPAFTGDQSAPSLAAGDSINRLVIALHGPAGHRQTATPATGLPAGYP